MIKPLYFPNIYIKEETADTLALFFDEVCVFNVSVPILADSEKEHERGIVKVIHPDYNDEDEFKEFLLTGFNSKPLYDPDRAFKLIAELQKRVEDAFFEDDTSLLDKHRVMRARMFLQMAYEYDVQSSLIGQELRECKLKEQALIKELQGFEEADVMVRDEYQEEKFISDTSDFQIEKRFESWIDIFSKSLDEDGKSGEGFYLTENRSVIDTIIEFEPELDLICSVQPADINKTELSGMISQMTECDWKTDKERFIKQSYSKNNMGTDKLMLYIVPEKDPFNFFMKFASVNKRGKTEAEHREIKRNTVIGFIDI